MAADFETDNQEPSTFGLWNTAAVGFEVGSMLGPYLLKEVVGEGGFGIVYRAEQIEPIRRQVALKVIKPGMDSKAVVSRFKAEEQALAIMDHPCVATVFDGGVTERGLPFFVMEFVDGLPITAFCDKRSLAIDQRVRLFIRVSEAVQHAHSKGVIHRDLKPSNILIEEIDGQPSPKVIDFGVAKALEQRLTEATLYTEQGQLMGTPEYMSPEQTDQGGGDIDTRSDVYSLGVVLYELLSGVRPFDARILRERGLAEILRVIRDEDPARPSTRVNSLASSGQGSAAASVIARRRRSELRALTGVLRRDLDWVVMKCLEKNRERRYETAEALGTELRRYLNDEPVLAGPPSASYKVGKFVRRNRRGVVAAGIALFLLLSGLGGTTYGLIRADQARKDANFRAEELEQVAMFQEEQLGRIDPQSMGVSLRDGLRDKVWALAEREGLSQAGIEHQVSEYDSLVAAADFTGLALGTLEEHVFQPSIEAISVQFEGQPLIQARLFQAIADSMRELGTYRSALEPQQIALDIRVRELGESHTDSVSSFASRGTLFARLGELPKAHADFEKVLVLRRQTLGEDHPKTIIALNNLGSVYQAQGMYAEASPYLERALDSNRRVLGGSHPDTLKSISNLGSLRYDQGRLAEALELHTEALNGRREVLGNSDASTLNSVAYMGLVYERQGKLEQATPFYQEALDGRRAALGNQHPETLSSISIYGLHLRRLGRLEEAEKYLREALTGRRATLGDDHISTSHSLNSVGLVISGQDRPSEAEPYYREALEIRRRRLPEDHPNVLDSTMNLGMLLQKIGRLEEAEVYLRNVLEARRRLSSNQNQSTLIAIHNLGGLLRQMERFDEAERLNAEAVQTGRLVLDEGHWLLGTFLSAHAQTLAAMEFYEEAERCGLESYEILVDSLGPQHDRTLGVAELLADMYASWSGPQSSGDLWEKSQVWRKKLEPVPGE